MRILVTLILTVSTLLFIACDRKTSQPVSPTSSAATERRIAELENRLNAIEQMVRTLDRRDDRLADMAASNSGSRTSSPRPVSNNAALREDLAGVDNDIDRINRQLESVSEQLTAIVEELQRIGEENNEIKTTLGDHDQALERILSGN